MTFSYKYHTVYDKITNIHRQTNEAHGHFRILNIFYNHKNALKVIVMWICCTCRRPAFLNISWPKSFIKNIFSLITYVFFYVSCYWYIISFAKRTNRRGRDDTTQEKAFKKSFSHFVKLPRHFALAHMGIMCVGCKMVYTIAKWM